MVPCISSTGETGRYGRIAEGYDALSRLLESIWTGTGPDDRMALTSLSLLALPVTNTSDTYYDVFDLEKYSSTHLEAWTLF